MATEPKYQNKKIVVDGIKFDSKDEARYYETLKRRQITEGLTFTRQPKLLLIPSFRGPCGALQRAITYSAYFLVTYSDSTQELIDIKGFSTQQGDLKRKLYNFLAFQPDRPVPGIPLRWVAYSQKYGDKDGWIDYDELQAQRRKVKKDKENASVVNFKPRSQTTTPKINKRPVANCRGK